MTDPWMTSAGERDDYEAGKKFRSTKPGSKGEVANKEEK